MSLKQKLKSKELTIGSWLTLPSTEVAEIMLQAGFDWLTVDMEHSAITLSEAQDLIQVISLGGKTPLVRVTDNDPNKIKRVMDAGAVGVIVPMVKTAEEARRAVDAVKYPPHGKRPVGFGRAQGYGVTFEKYKEWQKSESVVIVQIEHLDALSNLEGIFSVEGVDGYIVGPYDLSGSMGIAGELEHPRMKDAWQHIREVAGRHSIAHGYHVIPIRPELVNEKIREGFTFISFGLDTMFLAESVRSGLSQITK